MSRYVIGGAINTGSTRYIEFLVPGFLATVVLWNGMTVPAGVAEDAASGVHDRLRSLPIPRAAVMVGRAIADTSLLAWGLLATGLFSFAIGYRLHADVADLLLTCGLIVLEVFAFSWLFIALGLLARNAQAAQGMSMLVIPLAFVSSAYVPVGSMPGWLQAFAEHQPVTAITNAIRSLMIGGTGPAHAGHSTAYWVGLSIVWCAVIAVGSGAIAVGRFGRSR